MAPRASFATEFLLRELLSALGAPLTVDSAPADSFSESLSEDTEPQSAADGVQSRVMLVRRTNSSRHTATLVDREYDVEAFIPSHVTAILQKERGYQTLGRLRGSVIRITKYHFATMTRCLSADKQNRATSVSAPNVSTGDARVYLWVDALAIVEDNELAVQPHPGVYSHPLVEERLKSLSDSELEKQLMINQGLYPLKTTTSDRFDDDRPLLDEDCVIPEDQEQELEEQDEWGPPTALERQPTDSELIEENGTVPIPESQVVRGPVSTQDSTVSSRNLSVTLSGNPSVSLSGESSLDGQRFQFQQENILETFVPGSDVESSDTEDLDDELEEAETSTPKSGRKARSNTKHSPADFSPAPTQAIADLTENSTRKPPQSTTATRRNGVRNKKEEATTDVDGSEEAATNPHNSSHTLSKTHHPTKKQPTPKRWPEIFKVLNPLNIFTSKSTEDGGASLSDGEEGESLGNDEQVTQILDQQDKVEDEEELNVTEGKLAPEEFMSSQATVVLQYAVDNDEDANAFEYEGMTSPRSVIIEHDEEEAQSAEREQTDWADDLTLTEEGAEVAVTPQKKSESQSDAADFKTPSPSGHVSTPGTEKRAGGTSTISTAALKTPTDNNDLPTSPPSSKEPVLPTDPSGQLSPGKSPSTLVISVGSAGYSSNRINRTGFSTTMPRGSKRRLQQTTSDGPSPVTTSEKDNASESNAHKEAHSRTKQKRRRRDFLSEGSQSPQFEQPTAPLLPQRNLPPDRRTVVTDSYSLDAVCRSLGSNARHQHNEETHARSSQPRRAWKRYESLFPPLNMNRLKQMMAEGKRNK
ncbi:hypothetical protein GN958_ATG06560 [Phytophthora infestans]|uniref:Telomere replication protein EST3 n=1 Tax=Phytophthora infestans TaxID=4787 RepID=A0A8S9UZ35_PHYIN|nr:hypothetical protein GN958_ATG06560 [Phytophthora infestans]